MKRRLPIVLGIVAAVVVPGVATSQEKVRERSPNVVVFLADDLGWGDLASYGNPVIKTPNLDRFAEQGIRFERFYAPAPLCSPSRAAILTGRSPIRTGITAPIDSKSMTFLPADEITIATMLGPRGYISCHVGKWHLNGDLRADEQPQPDDHGFDWWFATQNNAGGGHISPNNFIRNGKIVGKTEGYSSQIIVQEAIDWLEHNKEPARPFYLNVWTHEPHVPIESDPKILSSYESIENGEVRQYMANVSQLDRAFGQLMTYLDKKALADDTIVFFASDNGPAGSGGTDRRRGSTGGLRGRKKSLYEGGIRVPGLVRWPGHIPPGKVVETPVYGVDLFATIAEVTGSTTPTDRAIDGISWMPLFSGGELERSRPMYWWAPHFDMQVAMTLDEWKILANDELTVFELYNLDSDPGEARNLALQLPEKLAEMVGLLRDRDREVRAGSIPAD